MRLRVIVKWYLIPGGSDWWCEWDVIGWFNWGELVGVSVAPSCDWVSPGVTLVVCLAPHLPFDRSPPKGEGGGGVSVSVSLAITMSECLRGH